MTSKQRILLTAIAEETSATAAEVTRAIEEARENGAEIKGNYYNIQSYKGDTENLQKILEIKASYFDTITKMFLIKG